MNDIISPGWAKRMKDGEIQANGRPMPIIELERRIADSDKLRLVKVYQIMNRWERAVTRYEGQDTEFLQDIAEVLK